MGGGLQQPLEGVHIKARHAGQVRRFTAHSWAELEQLCRTLFSIPEGVSVKITYEDEERDQVTMSSEEEFAEALRACGAPNRIDAPLSLFIAHVSRRLSHRSPPSMSSSTPLSSLRSSGYLAWGTPVSSGRGSSGRMESYRRQQLQRGLPRCPPSRSQLPEPDYPAGSPSPPPLPDGPPAATDSEDERDAACVASFEQEAAELKEMGFADVPHRRLCRVLGSVRGDVRQAAAYLVARRLPQKHAEGVRQLQSMGFHGSEHHLAAVLEQAGGNVGDAAEQLSAGRPGSGKGLKGPAGLGGKGDSPMRYSECQFGWPFHMMPPFWWCMGKGKGWKGKGKGSFKGKGHGAAVEQLRGAFPNVPERRIHKMLARNGGDVQVVGEKLARRPPQNHVRDLLRRFPWTRALKTHRVMSALERTGGDADEAARVLTAETERLVAAGEGCAIFSSSSSSDEP
eukprot:TRINITY_DN25177_c0_g1_i1.p1 TRINITY_DN25177_c0_g1~~TRINITY_DN25177_c0_g1_i1.p1  ORF type:complete len:453 (+),score=94.85 TRINITY_DN25177_c0_g1_i1:83-1441(+)